MQASNKQKTPAAPAKPKPLVAAGFSPASCSKVPASNTRMNHEQASTTPTVVQEHVMEIVQFPALSQASASGANSLTSCDSDPVTICLQ